MLAPPQAADELGRLGGYRVLRMLGMGGMGVVFQAEDISLKRLVALKVMNPIATSDSLRARFLREAQAMAAVHHDNVVTIYQLGEDRGAPFLAMELLEGESLSERLRADKQLSVDDALRIARETAQGLAAAHAKGLTHRDIKPDNVWLEGKVDGLGSRVEGENRSALALNPRPSTLNPFRVKILDFGLARAVDDEQNLTQSGAIVGTPNYLSPEQVMSEAVDPRTDQFSLGVVLYEMLSGVKPFARNTLMATLRSIGSDPPRELEASVPAEVSALVRRLLEKRPEDRFATTADVIAAIEHCERCWSSHAGSRTRESSDRSLTTSATTESATAVIDQPLRETGQKTEPLISRNALASGLVDETTIEPDASLNYSWHIKQPPKAIGKRMPRVT